MTDAKAWFKPLRRVTGARTRLLCIPFAGGGAWTFRPWPAKLPDDCDVLGVQLPGREDRLGDDPFTHLGPLVSALADAALPVLSDGTPYAVFGHSMGALIAYELQRELARRGAPLAGQLFVSGYRAPDLPAPYPPIHELADGEFVDEVARLYDAIPPAAREHEELMELLLPGLRADISVCDTYAHVEGEPLPCPIHVFGGEGDHHVSRADLEAWGALSAGRVEVTMLPGDHFFITTSLDELLGSVSAELPR